MTSLIASIPSPPWNAVRLGPFQLRFYGLMIALGVIAAARFADRRWLERGGVKGEVGRLAIWAVPAGILGARLYHVITDYELYTKHPWKAFAVWDGGLGIPGGIAAGMMCGLVIARRRNLAIPALLDSIAPALPLAQAIGRWGNWFNQELFGRPSTLPWAVRIDLAQRPAGLENYASFQPTFLYESVWNLAVIGLVLFIERQRWLRSGRLFAVYVGGYAFGRFFIERMRIDFAHTVAGLRVNEWISVVAFAIAIGFIATGRRSFRPAGTTTEHGPTS